MLDIIANIAGLLGFSLQVFDKFKKENPGKLGEYMGLFVGLTDTVQSWKEIHHNYQTFSPEIERIQRHFYTIDGPRDIGRILPENIRVAVVDSPFATAVYDFENNLKPAIHPLRYVCSFQDGEREKLINNIMANGFPDLAKSIHKISLLQEQVVNTHDEFCAFLKKVLPYMDEKHWNSSPHLELFYNNRGLLFTKFNSVGVKADEALLNFIDIFKFAANQVQS